MEPVTERGGVALEWAKLTVMQKIIAVPFVAVFGIVLIGLLVIPIALVFGRIVVLVWFIGRMLSHAVR